MREKKKSWKDELVCEDMLQHRHEACESGGHVRKSVSVCVQTSTGTEWNEYSHALLLLYYSIYKQYVGCCEVRECLSSRSFLPVYHSVSSRHS